MKMKKDNMLRLDRRIDVRAVMSAVSLLAVLGSGVLGSALVAQAQGMLQLDPITTDYTLGRFKYAAPRTDGWRQIANARDSLSLVYVESAEEGKVETRFGVVMEVADIPPEQSIPDAAFLAQLSRNQMAEQRKADIVALSPIEPVPSIENLYTYRFLVRAPENLGYNAYEVYYVAMAPDKTQYVVVQCITKNETYANEIYFNEFYASLPSLKYGGAAAASPPAGSASPPASAAEPAKPADAAEPAAGDHSGHDHAGHDHGAH
jgi:hypothetical protein